MSLLTAPAVPSFMPTRSQVEDEPLYEIIDGQKMDLPPMSILAVRIMSRLQTVLDSFVETQGLGTVVTEALFILDSVRNRRRRPDIAFVSAARWPLDRDMPEKGDWEVIPDLAIEVISSGELFEDAFDKLLEYFEVGVSQVWLVLPRHRQLHIYDSPTTVRILTDVQELKVEPLLPGLHLPLAPLFSRNATVSPKSANNGTETEAS